MKRIGYVLILVAMGAYALAALFLDFYSFGFGGVTYFELLTTSLSGVPSSATVVIGGMLTLFGPPLLIAILTLKGLAGRRPESASSIVVAAVATWVIVVAGISLGVAGREISVGPGFWVQVGCAGVTSAGALLLLVRLKPFTRAGGRPPDSASSNSG